MGEALNTREIHGTRWSEAEVLVVVLVVLLLFWLLLLGYFGHRLEMSFLPWCLGVGFRFLCKEFYANYACVSCYFVYFPSKYAASCLFCVY